jgi:hypothetical protein
MEAGPSAESSGIVSTRSVVVGVVVDTTSSFRSSRADNVDALVVRRDTSLFDGANPWQVPGVRNTERRAIVGKRDPNLGIAIALLHFFVASTNKRQRE